MATQLLCVYITHMEALGIVSIIYNHLENTLFLLILIYSELEYDVAKSRSKKWIIRSAW